MIWTTLVVIVVIVLLPFYGELRKVDVRGARRKTDEGHFAELSDGLTYYRWSGTATPSVVVLVHGLTTPNWVFSGLVRGLNMLGYQVLSYDLFGRGLSDHTRDSQTPQFFLRQLTELLDDQGLEGPVSILGYSMGGIIASLFAATYPERVDRLILLAPGGMDYQPPQPLRLAGTMGLVGDWLWRLAGGRAVRAAARAEAKGPTVIPDFAKRMAEETRRRGYLRAVLSAHRETLGINLEDIHRDLGRTEIPVLAIWGGLDPVIPQTSMGKLTQWNRNTRHHVIEGAGHGLPHTAPNDVIGAITTFFREV